MDFSGIALDTGRLVLRGFTEADLPAMADMHARPEVARFLYWEPRDERASREALRRHLDLRLAEDGDHLTLAGVEKGTERFVGEYTLFLRSATHAGGEVGFILHPDLHGRGYATEGARAMLRLGFERMGLHRIVGRLDPRNTSSAAVLAKLGMRQEAHFVSNEYVKGEWTDEAVYALLDSEWRSSLDGD